MESKKLNDNRSRHVSLILDYLKKVVVSKEYQPFISPKAIYHRVFNKDLKSTLSSSLRSIPQAKYALELRSDCILNFVDNINTFDYSLDSDTLGAKYYDFINSSQYLSSPRNFSNSHEVSYESLSTLTDEEYYFRYIHEFASTVLLTQILHLLAKQRFGLFYGRLHSDHAALVNAIKLYYAKYSHLTTLLLLFNYKWYC